MYCQRGTPGPVCTTAFGSWRRKSVLPKSSPPRASCRSSDEDAARPYTALVSPRARWPIPPSSSSRGAGAAAGTAASSMVAMRARSESSSYGTDSGRPIASLGWIVVRSSPIAYGTTTSTSPSATSAKVKRTRRWNQPSGSTRTSATRTRTAIHSSRGAGCSPYVRTSATSATAPAPTPSMRPVASATMSTKKNAKTSQRAIHVSGASSTPTAARSW